MNLFKVKRLLVVFISGVVISGGNSFTASAEFHDGGFGNFHEPDFYTRYEKNWTQYGLDRDDFDSVDFRSVVAAADIGYNLGRRAGIFVGEKVADYIYDRELKKFRENEKERFKQFENAYNKPFDFDKEGYDKHSRENYGSHESSKERENHDFGDPPTFEELLGISRDDVVRGTIFRSDRTGYVYLGWNEK